MLSSPTTVIQNYEPEVGPRRVLLFNPPVYDTRFPWHHWQQPVALLQLATLLRSYQCDIRLIDALYTLPDEKITKRRMRVLSRGEIAINYWRFGKPRSQLTTQLLTLSKEGWQPDEVYIMGFTTFWWEGVAEAITLVKHRFPKARVILGGAYPALATEHAATHSGADIIVASSVQGLSGLPLDLSLYPVHPRFTYLSIGTNRRSASDLIDEFLTKANPTNPQERIGQFAFADHDVINRYPEQFRSLLKVIIDRKLKVSFYALGNIKAHDLADDPELASLLIRAGFKQLFLADDRDLPLTEEAREAQLDNTRHAIEHCVAAGYKPRTEALVASVCIGRLGEQLADITTFMTKIAHVAGSLMVVPYQPSPAECDSASALELQNGKLFPLAEHNSMSYRIYQDLVGLAAVLNAKYRSCTFDFLGEGLISRLVRSSLVNESWDLHKLPDFQDNQPVTVGWFNKEGKWVRS